MLQKQILPACLPSMHRTTSTSWIIIVSPYIISASAAVMKKTDTQIMPDDVLHKLSCVMESYPYGLKPNYVTKNYAEMFGVPLDYKAIGFSKLTKFLEACPEVVELIKNEANESLVYPTLLIKGKFICSGCVCNTDL